MSEFLIVLWAVLPVFAIMAAGATVRRLNWLTEEADHSLLRLTINLLVPCFIVDKALGNPALHHLGNVTIAPVVGFSTITLGIVVGLWARRIARAQDARAGRTFAFSVGIYNWGYIPLPLAMSLFDPGTVGVLIVHNLGTELAFWSIGTVMLGGLAAGTVGKKLLNPPLVAIVGTLILNAFGGRDLMPGFLLATAKLLGDCAIPMGLTLIGATIADHLHEFHSASGWRVMGTACVVRLGVLPLTFLLLARYLPCSVELKKVIVLQAAMPSAVFNILMAKHYGGDPPTALRVVLSTTAVGLITIPLWIRFGMKFVGLE